MRLGRVTRALDPPAFERQQIGIVMSGIVHREWLDGVVGGCTSLRTIFGASEIVSGGMLATNAS